MKENYCIEDGGDSAQVTQFLEDKIYEYNSNRLKKYDGCYFSKIIRDKNKNIIAGVGGWTWAGACEIAQLWVDESARKLGLGKKLLESAESEAKSKGCLTVLVRTYSFQAPGFYEKYGYKTEYMLSEFPEGFNYYILTKRIVARNLKKVFKSA